MNGALIVSSKNKRLHICIGCFLKEFNDIKLAIKLKYIDEPVDMNIEQCGLCFKNE